MNVDNTNNVAEQAARVDGRKAGLSVQGYPLRKIVERKDGIHILSCGHKLPKPADASDYDLRKSRRCVECGSSRHLTTSEDEAADQYARRLLSHLAPQVEPLPTLLGVLTQIDSWTVAHKNCATSEGEGRCTKCGHAGKCDKYGKCKVIMASYQLSEYQLAAMHEEFREDAGTLYCNCHCEFPAPSVPAPHTHAFKQVEGQSSTECECGATPDYPSVPARNAASGGLCTCGHDYNDHKWAMIGTPEPCKVAGCQCADYHFDLLATPPEAAPSSGDVARLVSQFYENWCLDDKWLIDEINILVNTKREHVRTVIVGLVREYAKNFMRQSEGFKQDGDVETAGGRLAQHDTADYVADLIQHAPLDELMKGDE